MTKASTPEDTRYRELFAAMTDLVIVFDRDVRCNEPWLAGALEMAGLPEDPTGMTATQIFPGKAGTAITTAVKQTIDSGSSFSFEFELPERNQGGEARANGGSGNLRVLHATVSAVPPEPGAGHSGSAILVARDLTERRLIEDQLLQSQKLESVGTLVGGIAHDFNNLLMAILGYSEMLLMNLPSEDPKKRYAQRINQAGERARSLVQQMLLYSRREAPRMGPLDANACVNSAIELLSRSLDKKIQLRTELEWQLPMVMADRVQIDQALMNICVNGAMALKSRKNPEEPGTIQVSTSRIDYEEGDSWPYHPAQPGSYVSITIEDNGIGMTEEVQSRIFEPFFTTREPGEGTGLGLSVAFSIIRKHKGYLLLNSTPGVGTTFQILLPVRSGMATPGRAANGSGTFAMKADRDQEGTVAAGQSRLFQTVMVADDEDGARGVIGEYLREMGYRVLEAVDGLDAVKLYKKRGEDVDLILMDVVMPRMNGVEATRKILHIDPQARILFITGHARGYVQGEAFDDEGVMGVIHKPFSLKEIDRKVKRALAT
jgi:signal transduction histidine kinase/ActR/RegA family two-component response regulator